MFVKSLKIKNYKSFFDSEEIEFHEGVNLITGINNAGKTALLEILGSSYIDKPFRGSKSGGGQSHAVFKFRILNKELFPEELQNRFLIPEFQEQGGSGNVALNLLNKVVDQGYMDVCTLSRANEPIVQFMYPYKDTELLAVPNSVFHMTRESHGGFAYEVGMSLPGRSTPEQLIRDYVVRRFFFNSDRINLHTAPFAYDQLNLESNARNLANLLYIRHNENSDRFREKYVRQVSRVLPNIRSIKTSYDGRDVTLFTSPEEQSAEHSPVELPLEDSGSGIGQVLAMLYLIVYGHPSIIVIDEVDLFLHPGALRQLLLIFNENRQHQYFISTHAATVFSCLRPSNFIRLTLVDGKTKAKNCSFGDLRDTYGELGISPFFEKALWVEGETEVAAFPLILQDPSIQFLKVYSASETGNLVKRKGIDRVLELHSNMIKSRQGEPLLSTMKILLDGEHIGKDGQAHYEKRTDSVVYFLPRKMFENYLLHPDAIAELLTELDGNDVSPSSILDLLEQERGEGVYEDWILTAHGANILNKIFTKLTDARCAYNKVEHSVDLVRRINHCDETYFGELRDFVIEMFRQERQ